MADNLDESKLPDDKAFSQDEYYNEGDVTPKHLLGFAKTILAVVAVMYILSGLSELVVSHNAVYEACKITLPSIATLVIGYYFGSSK